MSPLTSRICRRYGQLRIYISSENQVVGWYDPRSGQSQLSQPHMHDEFWAAAGVECQRLLLKGLIAELPSLPPGAIPAAQPPTSFRPPGPVPAESSGQPGAGSPTSAPPWELPDPEEDDLARNQPGASAGARARELRREHPLLTSAAALVGIRASAQQFAAGARGERVVGRQLNRCAERYGWHVVHAVPVGRRGADIDHVIIGPFGVVTVNTKTTGTAVWVGEYGLTIGGKPVDYLRKSRNEASRASQLLHRATGLEVPVQPVIVFVGARRVTVRRGGPPDVAVLASPGALRRWLLRQPPVLQPDLVETIYEAARRPASWQSR